MICNVPGKRVDMERQDIEWILNAYVRQYLFASKNEDPECIILPMFDSIPHPGKVGARIPVRYVPPISPEAKEIETDGNTTGSRMAELERKIAALEEEKQAGKNIPKRPSFEETTGSTVKVPQPARVAKQPPVPAVGSVDGMHPRSTSDQRIVIDALKDQADIDETREKPFEKKIGRDSVGNPVVED